ncbi:MAG: hypothetical protein IJO63_03315 [Bacilli bacterium]|nr:hypothetical protein [Bacilli bacterium]
MAKQDNKILTYKDYLEKLNKNELMGVLDTFHLEYKKNCKKQVYVDLILENVNHIVKHTLDLFQIDEFHNIKLFVKKKGKITIRVNHLLLDFMRHMERNKLVISDNKTFYLPKELLDSFKNKLNNKKVISKVKENTEEYKLILGFIDVYGTIDYNKFYESYSKKYKLTKEDALVRIKDIANFYGEFKFYEDNKKKKIYIASNVIKSLKECKTILNKATDYAVFTNEELATIHDFSYMAKYKSYKKLMKFINRNYYVEKGSQKIVNKYVLIPYLTNYQLNKESAKNILSSLIDTYFEFNNKKHKNKFMNLVENLALDYPSWNLKGHSEREAK